MDSHTEKNISTVICPGGTEGFLSNQNISGSVPLENPAVIELPHYHHQTVWQHFAHLAFEMPSKNEDEKLLKTASI